MLVRPVEPQDKARIHAELERLGPESRYRRHPGPTADLTDSIRPCLPKWATTTTRR